MLFVIYNFEDRGANAKNDIEKKHPRSQILFVIRSFEDRRAKAEGRTKSTEKGHPKSQILLVICSCEDRGRSAAHQHQKKGTRDRRF